MKAINKGKGGEQEVAEALEILVRHNMKSLAIPLPATAIVQRNQNQSAVGGKDLINTFGLAIEVKRQETLSINSWWRQCEEAAERYGEVPVLLYRQNRKPWRCITWGHPSSYSELIVRIEISWEDFLAWFNAIVHQKLVEVCSE